MKVVLFEILSMRQIGPDQWKVAGTTKDVPINPDQVCYVVPAIIPTDLTGPKGQPILREGTCIQFNGTALLVDEHREVVLWRLANDFADIAGAPKPRSEPEPEPKVAPRLRLVRPDLREFPNDRTS